jgi:hypothetical protein
LGEREPAEAQAQEEQAQEEQAQALEQAEQEEPLELEQEELLLSCYPTVPVALPTLFPEATFGNIHSSFWLPHPTHPLS